MFIALLHDGTVIKSES